MDETGASATRPAPVDAKPAKPTCVTASASPEIGTQQSVVTARQPGRICRPDRKAWWRAVRSGDFEAYYERQYGARLAGATQGG